MSARRMTLCRFGELRTGEFSLVTGEPLQLPALRPTPVYPAEVHAGEVLLTLP